MPNVWCAQFFFKFQTDRRLSWVVRPLLLVTKLGGLLTISVTDGSKRLKSYRPF